MLSDRSDRSTALWVDSEGTLHEQYTALFFVGQTELGTTAFDSARAVLHYRRHGVAYFCPTCGEIWARTAFIDSRGAVAPFAVEEALCAVHGDGTFCAEWLEGILDLLPPAALHREFELELQRVEKGELECSAE